jgi:hypothetical protein
MRLSPPPPRPPAFFLVLQALVGLATGHPEWQNRLGLAGLCSRVTESLRQWPDDYGIQLSGTHSSSLILVPFFFLNPKPHLF